MSICDALALYGPTLGGALVMAFPLVGVVFFLLMTERMLK